MQWSVHSADHFRINCRLHLSACFRRKLWQIQWLHYKQSLLLRHNFEMAKNINFQTQKLLTWKNTFELPRGMECIQMTKTFLRLQMDVFCHFKFCHDKWNHLVTVQAVLAYRNSVTVLWLVSFWINLIPFENLPFTKLVAGCEVECMTVLFWDNSLTILSPIL